MKTDNLTLAQLAAGEHCRVQSLQMTGHIRSRLLDIGLIPGTDVTCVQTGNGIAAYRIRSAIIALRDCDAQQIRIA